VAGSAARKFRRVVQVNTQRRSNPWCEKIREKYIRSGKLAPTSKEEPGMSASRAK
jgi:hypothetical protein